MGLGGVPLWGGAPLTELAGAVRAWLLVTEQTQPSETQIPSPSSSTLLLCHFTSLHLFTHRYKVSDSTSLQCWHRVQ